MKSILLTIEYANGNKLEQVVHYVHVEHNTLCFGIKKQVNFIGSLNRVEIPLENVKSFDITETDRQFN